MCGVICAENIQEEVEGDEFRSKRKRRAIKKATNQGTPTCPCQVLCQYLCAFVLCKTRRRQAKSWCLCFPAAVVHRECESTSIIQQDFIMFTLDHDEKSVISLYPIHIYIYILPDKNIYFLESQFHNFDTNSITSTLRPFQGCMYPWSL